MSTQPMLADNDTLTEWAANHQKESPGHGYNCHCADALIQEIRRSTRVRDDSLSFRDRQEAQYRVQYVLTQAGKIWP